MSKIILATASTNNYSNKIFPYLNSIENYSNFDKNILITLDYHSNKNFTKIDTYYLSNKIISNKNHNNCIQHGEFLKCPIFDTFDDDDYICFTDGDIIMQRGLDEDEKQLVLSLQDKDILVQYNNGKNDNLYKESKRLSSVTDLPYFERYPCYNTGVLICKLKTWKQISFYYSILYPLTSNIFRHYALQQWTLSYIINYIFNPIIMSYTFHTHHHYGIIDGNTFKNNQIYYENELVLFAHHII